MTETQKCLLEVLSTRYTSFDNIRTEPEEYGTFLKLFPETSGECRKEKVMELCSELHELTYNDFVLDVEYCFDDED